MRVKNRAIRFNSVIIITVQNFKMPKAYIPKPIKLVNQSTITKIGLDISNFSRSQAKGVDSFISLIKKANRRSDLREEVADEIFEFAEALKGLNADQVRDTLRSVRNQINRREEYKQEPKKFKYELNGDIATYVRTGRLD